MGEFAVDARKVALSKEQCLFVLERSGELIAVASQVGSFAGEAILRGLELGRQSVQDVFVGGAYGRDQASLQCVC